MNAGNDETDLLHDGGWRPGDGDESPMPGQHMTENTLGRRFPWPEGAGDPVVAPGGAPGPRSGGGPAAEPGFDPFAEPGAGPAAEPGFDPFAKPAVDPFATAGRDSGPGSDGEHPNAQYETQWIPPSVPKPPSYVGHAGETIDIADHDPGYRGSRRADSLLDRRWPVVVGVIVVVSVLLALVLVLANSYARPTAAVPDTGMGAGTPPAPASPVPSGGPQSALPIAVPTMGMSVPPSHGQNPTPSPVSASPTVLRPVTYEAEAPGNDLGGSANTRTYDGASGGRVVSNLGDWGSNAGPGTLTVRDVTAPENAVYRLTFYFVHPDDARQRTVVITVAGVGSFSVTVQGNATCCNAQRVTVTLHKGANAITFGNPDGHAPSIDKIVISGV
jgi:hypothetical protein